MSNLATARKTQSYAASLIGPQLGPYGAAEATTYYPGTMQTLDSSGRPKNPGTVTEIVAGIVFELVDNSAGANDAKNVIVRPGCYKLTLHGTHPPTAADLLKPAYASSNHEISRLASDGSLAGIVILVETDGVWVWVGPPAIGVAAALAGLTATALTDNSGGAAADGTIGVVTAPTALTDSTGGAASATLAAITTFTPSVAWNGSSVFPSAADATAIAAAITSEKNSIASLAARQAEDRTAIIALTDAIKELSTKINTIISDLG
jgi:hypothetical protein